LPDLLAQIKNLEEENQTLKREKEYLMQMVVDSMNTKEALSEKIIELKKEISKLSTPTTQLMNQARNVGYEIIKEIASKRQFFEVENPSDVVKRDSMERCTFTRWLDFILVNVPLMGSFITGMFSYHIDHYTSVTRDMKLALAMANLVDYVCPRWHWTMSFVVTTHIRSKAQSPLLTDIVATYLPGSYSERQLNNIEKVDLEENLNLLAEKAKLVRDFSVRAFSWLN
jgi:hypothetical protein